MPQETKPTLWERTKDVAATYTGTFIVVMLLNQLLFFGFCLNPICIIAAMPHVLLITVAVGTFISKAGKWGERGLVKKTSGKISKGIDNVGQEFEASLKEEPKHIPKQNPQKANLSQSKNNSGIKLTTVNKTPIQEKPTRSLKKISKPEQRKSDFDGAFIDSLNKKEIKNPVFISEQALNRIVATLYRLNKTFKHPNALYHRDVSNILSKSEINSLYVYKAVCRDLFASFDTFIKPHKEMSFKNIFASSPSNVFHTDQYCEVLRKNQHYFTYPHNLRDTDKSIFRYFLLDNKEDLILEREAPQRLINGKRVTVSLDDELHHRFLLGGRAQDLITKNNPNVLSMSQTLRYIESDLAHLEVLIENLINQADLYKRSSEEISTAIREYGNESHLHTTYECWGQCGPGSGPINTWHCVVKSKLKYLLKDHFKARFNDQLCFEKTDLSNLGFKQCPDCLKDEIAF